MPKSILPASTSKFTQEEFIQKVLTRFFSGITSGLMVCVVPMAAPTWLISALPNSGAMAQTGAELSGNQYIVYLSGATQSNLRRARTAVPDAFISTLSNGTRVVQLGRFNNLNLAQRRLSQIQSKGLAPQIYTQTGAIAASDVSIAPAPPTPSTPSVTPRPNRATTVPSNIPSVPSAFIATGPAALPPGSSANGTDNNNATNPFNVPVPPGNTSTATNSQTTTVRGSGMTVNRNNNAVTTGDNQAMPLPNVPRPVNSNPVNGTPNPNPPQTGMNTAQPIPIERTAAPVATSPTSIEIVRPSGQTPTTVAMSQAPANGPSNRYFVIIPNGSVADLQRARNFSPSAQVKSSGRGTYIEVQGYPDRLSAETMNSTMRKQGFDSRVAYF
ncbi:MAG: hypothetical protein WCO45_02690 [Pseudanabaena sp. ELA607]